MDSREVDGEYNPDVFLKEEETSISTFWSNIPVVEKLPKEWYDPEEDAEWEAYL